MLARLSSSARESESAQENREYRVWPGDPYHSQLVLDPETRWIQRFATNKILLLIQLLFLAVWLRKNKGRSSIALREGQLEWIVIMKLGTLVGVRDDRAVAVICIWSGFAGLARRSPQ